MGNYDHVQGNTHNTGQVTYEHISSLKIHACTGQCTFCVICKCKNAAKSSLLCSVVNTFNQV